MGRKQKRQKGAANKEAVYVPYAQVQEWKENKAKIRRWQNAQRMGIMDYHGSSISVQSVLDAVEAEKEPDEPEE